LLLCLFLFFIATGQLAYGQSGKLSGVVISTSDNQPIPGANVTIKGTTTGTITDIDGKFAIEVKPDDILVVSFVGYKSQEIAVAGKKEVTVLLEEEATKLDEVVVVGYGTMKKSDLSSAQVSISSEELSKSVVTSIDQALQGRAAGVYVTQNSGAPGGAVSVNIRGINSISGNTEPMYVIDGIQIMGDSKSNALSGINPDDIESINILQGPAATSIYGSRAGNGVVVYHHQER